MKKITTFIKKLQLRSFVTILLAGVILLVSTACNSGDVRGARPNNSPVQLGGQNNPHKMGGDGMTKYKASPNPQKGQAMLPNNQLIAAVPNIEEKNPGLLYKNDTETNERDLPLITDEQYKGNDLPNTGQEVIDRSDPNEGILEKTKAAFEEGSEFIKGAGKQVSPSSTK